MKKIIILLTIILISKLSNANEFKFTLDNFNSAKTFELLFNAKYNEEKKLYVWQANFEQYFNKAGNVNQKGEIHTKLDTVLYFENNNQQMALAVYGNYSFDEDEMEIDKSHSSCCIFSLALCTLAKGNSWELINFKNFAGACGSFGETAFYSIETIGKNNKSFITTDSYAGSGGTELILHIYSLETLGNIWYKIIESEYCKGEGKRELNCDFEEWKYKFIPSNKDYYDIKIDFTKNEQNKSKKYVLEKKVFYYTYNEEVQKYLKK